MDLEQVFNELEARTTDESTKNILAAPFGYPGGKSRSVRNILQYLPYTDKFVDVFAGSGTILLAREPSRLEVYNDRYAGVTAFYRCIKSEKLCRQLADWIDTTVHSKELWWWCKETWDSCDDLVERAGRWYYMVCYSFGSLGRNWGRGLEPKAALSGKIRNRIKKFSMIHDRFRKVQIDNLDGLDCISQYDSPTTVFYVDPDYPDASRGIYKHEMTDSYHIKLLDLIFKSEGFFAVSGYHNILYDKQQWDDCHTWTVHGSAKSVAGTGGYKSSINEERSPNTEVLWIKEFS